MSGIWGISRGGDERGGGGYVLGILMNDDEQ